MFNMNSFIKGIPCIDLTKYVLIIFRLLYCVLWILRVISSPIYANPNIAQRRSDRKGDALLKFRIRYIVVDH